MDQLREAGNVRSALLAVTARAPCTVPNRRRLSCATGQAECQRGLDAVQLHKLVLEETLGIWKTSATKHKYVRDAKEAVEEVRRGANVAFLMNPVRMEQVRDIAFGGEVLPQKSTDFFPKLLSGLTIYSLEDDAQDTAAGGH